MRKLILALFFVLALPPAGAQTPTPKETVLAFYKLALADMKPKEAFTRYMSPDFIEHDVEIPGGTAQATADFLDNLIHHAPRPKWEIIRSIAEGDLVVLHVRFTPAPGAPPTAIAEIFRVRGNTIAEHWDVVQHAPDKAVNPNPVF